MDRIIKRRQLIGSPIDMAVKASELLERPDGKRSLARRAIATGFRTDQEAYTNLCSDPDDGLYITELLQLCTKMGIPTTKGITKSQIADLLRGYVNEAFSCTENLPENTQIELAERRLRLALDYNKRISAGDDYSAVLSTEGEINIWGAP